MKRKTRRILKRKKKIIKDINEDKDINKNNNENIKINTNPKEDNNKYIININKDDENEIKPQKVNNYYRFEELRKIDLKKEKTYCSFCNLQNQADYFLHKGCKKHIVESKFCDKCEHIICKNCVKKIRTCFYCFEEISQDSIELIK